MPEILFFIFLGVIAGVVAGLLPGIHPNLISILAGSVLMGMDFFPDTFCFISFMVSMGMSNSFVNVIPSISFSVPDPETSLTILPGHKMLLKGYGYHAIKLTVIGSLGGLFICAALLPIIIKIVPILYNLLRPNLHWALTTVVIYMILAEKKRLIASSCFLLSGLIGILGSQLPINQNFYLFAVLTGLFGFPMLILSIKNNSIVPNQKIKDKYVSRIVLNRSVVAGSLAGLITGLLPGIGVAQATVLASIGQRKSDAGFLISMGAVTTTNILFSFLAIWLIGKPRSGVAAVVNQFVEIGFNEFLVMILAALIAGGIATVITLKSAKIILNIVQKVNYVLINKLIVLFLFLLIFYFTGLHGIFLTFIATCLGIFTNLNNVRRTHLMGVLLLQTILFFAGA